VVAKSVVSTLDCVVCLVRRAVREVKEEEVTFAVTVVLGQKMTVSRKMPTRLIKTLLWMMNRYNAESLPCILLIVRKLHERRPYDEKGFFECLGQKADLHRLTPEDLSRPRRH
jgi:hypothetical protein